MNDEDHGTSDTVEDEEDDENDELDDGYEIDDEFADPAEQDLTEMEEMNDNVVVNEDHLMNRMDQPLL